MSRRAFGVGLMALAGAWALPRPAMALTEQGAADLVNQVVADIFKSIDSGKSEQQLYRDFERIFAKYADVNIIARQALGPPARTASRAQMRAFTEAFQGYISRKYGRRFREFIGGRIEIKSSRQVKSGIFEVRTTAYLRGEAPFEVKFMVSDKSGRDTFYNMFIEGINMMATERTEIGTMLDKRRGDIDQLTADLRKI